MNAETGEDMGIEATKTFVAEAPTGSIDLEFQADTSKLGGTSLVFFEEAYIDKEPEPIATHKDLMNKDQTVHIVKNEEEPTPAPTKTEEDKAPNVKKTITKTGDYLYAHPFLAMALVSGAASIVSFRMRNLRRRQTRKRSRSI